MRGGIHDLLTKLFESDMINLRVIKTFIPPNNGYTVVLFVRVGAGLQTTISDIEDRTRKPCSSVF
jgi:hypothetical protein